MIYQLLYSHIIYPLYHISKQDKVLRAIRDFKANQWKNRDEIVSIQKVKLRKLLVHAYQNVPYYQEKAMAAGVNTDQLISSDPHETLAYFPVLTKKEIRKYGDALISNNLEGNYLYNNSTSGSTGEALYFYSDFRSSAYRKSATIRCDEWTGCRLGDRLVRLWGAPMDLDRVQSFRGSIHKGLTRQLYLSSYDLSETVMEQYCRMVASFKPRLFVSYPGPLEVFANFVQNRSVAFPTIKSIITSAEQLFPYQRDLFEQVFKAKVFNRYGCREFGAIAQECEFASGLHVCSDRVMVEILNNRGQPCKPGDLGEIFVTDLDNYGMPLIRYQIGDLAAWSTSQQCECGRGLPLLAQIEGRSLDVIRTPGGLCLGGTYWTLLFRSKRGIKQFQIVQSRKESIRVKYIPDEQFTPEVLLYFENRIHEQCGYEFEVLYEPVDHIKKTKSGKNRIVISNC